MHDGSIATLEGVIYYYDRGGNRNPGLDPEIRALHLSSAEKQNIIRDMTTKGLTSRLWSPLESKLSNSPIWRPFGVQIECPQAFCFH